jgi:hypothetical protein
MVDELVQTIQLIKSADFGCALSFTAGHDEQGRFASAYFGEVPLQWIYLSYTQAVYVLYILYIFMNTMTIYCRNLFDTPYKIC